MSIESGKYKEEENIIYSNKNDFLNKLENIKNEGFENLHFLADFDRTLTKAFSDDENKRGKGISVFKENSLGFDDNFCTLEQQNFEKYYPLENNPDLDLEEKKKYMIEWWIKTFELFIKFGLTKEKIKNAVFNGKIEFRKGIDVFCKNLEKNNVPLIIISASGLGKYWIEYFFEKEKLFSQNIEIVSNKFIWNNDGKATGWKEPIIHSFNKSETILKDNVEIYSKIKNRKNVILLGDSLGDHHMVDGFEYKNLIKIGFLNDIPHLNPILNKEKEQNEKILEEYKKRYDVIIIGDGDFNFINNLLEEIK